MSASPVSFYEHNAKNRRSSIKSSPKQKWTPEEDQKLIDLVQKYNKVWRKIALEMENRTGKQCRERWFSNLNPNINKNPYSYDEDMLILKLHKKLGGQWSLMKQYFNNRTDISIKNRWKWIEKKGIFNESHECVYSPQEICSLLIPDDFESDPYSNSLTDNPFPIFI